MLLELHPQNPNPRNLKTILECLKDGGLIIYPTDTVYGIGCDIFRQKGILRICQIKHLDPKKAQFSFICYDLSHLSDYTRNVDTPLFRLLKKSLPGPFTFILPASKLVPKLLKTKKNTVGIRVPDNLVCRTIVRELGNPLINTSLSDNEVEYYTDPELIHEKFKDVVDIVVNGGIGGVGWSTVLDCTGPEPLVLRQGIGKLEEFA
ncbi:MAG: L-threonylcarbamoyladenylate synthase [Chitinophagaceae bacterium]